MNAAVIQAQLDFARAAARVLRSLDRATKDRALRCLADLLGQRRAEVLKANAEDLAALDPKHTAAFRDRLTLTDKRIDAMIEGLRQVAAHADPVGEIVEDRNLSNGVRIRRVRSPLGVILMIFESRPNVAIEAFSLAFKSGNAILLRAGKEAMRTTGALYALMREALQASGAPENAVIGITDPSRELTDYLLTQNRLIDVVVPRGGDALIEHVSKHSSIPVIKNDRGMCHVYVHEDADLAMAERIVENAKTQRPGVCNAMETLLVHARVAAKLLPALHARLATVEFHADPASVGILAGLPRVVQAGPNDFDTEYLDLKLNVRVVASLEEAIAHIERHGSRHSEAIVTASEPSARRFQSEIDAAAVYWNASTRFTDGFELGLGGELGISTQKLHVRGPVGLRELTSVRWVMDGVGQIRS